MRSILNPHGGLIAICDSVQHGYPSDGLEADGPGQRTTTSATPPGSDTDSDEFASVKLNSDLTINGKLHRAGDEIAWTAIYPFFLFHMLLFGGSGFFMAYHENGAPLGFLYLHGGFAIAIYLVFYLAIFGREEVKWMVINSALGVFGIYSQIDWLLSFFGKTAGSYPWYVHVIPFLYYVLYTFLLWQAVLDVTGARQDESKRKIVERSYVGISLGVYAAFHFL